VSGQLGHTDPTTTLRTYQHLFDAARHAADATRRTEERYGKFLESRDRNELQSDGPPAAAEGA
jgi:hypothetical protein